MRTWFCSLKGTYASAVLSGIFLIPGAAQAQEGHQAHPEDGREVVYLSFEQALRRGAEFGPDVTEAKAPRASANEAVRRAHPLFSQVPVVQGQLGPRVSSGRTTPELIVSISQPIPLMNTGKVQENLARAERSSVEKNIDLASLDSAERAGHAWINLAYSEELLQLRAQANEQAELYLRVVESRAKVGEIDQGDLALAQSELASMQALVLQAEGEHFLAASELSYVAGLSESQRADVKTVLSDLPILQETPQKAVQSSHPALVSAEALVEASKQAVGYAKSQQIPALSFGVQYQREGTGDQILTGTFTVPIPLWKPWHFQEARQRVHYDQQRAQAQRVKTELALEMERSEHEYTHATAHYELIKSRAIPPRKESLRIAMAKFEAGETDFLRVSWARRELLTVEEQMAAALAALHRARLHLLRSTGTLREKQG